jgi:hypothetical protein
MYMGGFKIQNKKKRKDSSYEKSHSQSSSSSFKEGLALKRTNFNSSLKIN